MRSLKNRNVLSYAMFPSIGSCQDSANEKSESDSKKKKINKNRKYSVSWMKNRKIAKLLSFKRRFLSRIRRKNSIVDDRLEGNQNRGGIYSILLTRILRCVSFEASSIRWKSFRNSSDRVYFIYKRRINGVRRCLFYTRHVQHCTY